MQAAALAHHWASNSIKTSKGVSEQAAFQRLHCLTLIYILKYLDAAIVSKSLPPSIILAVRYTYIPTLQ